MRLLAILLILAPHRGSLGKVLVNTSHIGKLWYLLGGFLFCFGERGFGVGVVFVLEGVLFVFYFSD